MKTKFFFLFLALCLFITQTNALEWKESYYSENEIPDLEAENQDQADYYEWGPLYFNVESGSMKFRAPKFSYGFIYDPITLNIIDELDTFTVRDNPQAPYVELLLGYQFQNLNLPSWAGDSLALEVYGSIFKTETKRRTYGPFLGPFGIGIAIPVLDSPLSIAFVSGISTITIFGDLTRSYRYEAIGLKLKSLYLLPSTIPIHLSPYIDLGINEFVQHYELNMTIFILPIPPINGPLDIRENLRSTFYDLGLGLRADTFLTQWFGAFIEGGVYASLALSRLTAHQSSAIQITLPPIAEQHIFNSNWSSKFKGSAGLTFAVRKWTLALTGNYEYWGFMPRVQNPTATTALISSGKAAIANSSSYNYSVGIKISTPL